MKRNNNINSKLTQVFQNKFVQCREHEILRRTIIFQELNISFVTKEHLLPRFHVPFWLSFILFSYFTNVLFGYTVRLNITKINKLECA